MHPIRPDQGPRSLQRSTGAYYTSPAIAEVLVREALSRLTDVAGRPPSCLDPAVGMGVFLVALVEEAFAWLPASRLGDRARRLEQFACECLHGVDVDPGAVAQARAAVLGEVRRVADAHRLGVNLDRISEALARHIIVGDSLAGGPDRTHYPLVRGAPFDLIASNPPFVSFSGREAAPLTGERRVWLRETYATARGWPGLAPLFIELCAALLREGGVMALVLPGALLHQPRYAAPRALLHEAFADPDVHPLPEDAFEGVSVSTVTVVATRASGTALRPECAPQLPLWPPGCVSLSEVATVRDWGVHTGNVRSRILASGATHHTWVPVLRGRDVTPFHVSPPALYLDPRPSLLAGEYCRISGPESYRAGKLLVRQTAGRPIVAVDGSGSYFLNSLLAVYPRCDPHALCAVLNSESVARYYRDAFPEARQRAFPQVKKTYLDAIPVPRCLLDPANPAARGLARLGRDLAESPPCEGVPGSMGRVEKLLSEPGAGAG